MAAQPLNTDITVHLTVRSFRQTLRNESVAALIKRLRPNVMMVPANEILVEVKARDTASKDFSPYMGQASATATRGFPIVVGLKDQMSFAHAQASVANIDFGFRIGQDWFLKKTAAGLADDLHQDLRDVSLDIDE